MLSNMNNKHNEEEETTLSNQKNHKRTLNKSIWLWSCGKNLTKREIKDYAIKIFKDAGISSFKASDGWYRRWINNWKHDRKIKNYVKTDKLIYSKRLIQDKNEIHNICDEKDETNEINTNFHTDMDFYTRDIDVDCNKLNLPEKSELTNTQWNDELPSNLHVQNKQYLEDCKITDRLPDCVQNEKNISIKRNGSEKYFPHFKAKVVTFALNHSIKKAACCFKVNKDTISDWLRESQNISLKDKGHVRDTPCSILAQNTPDEYFIDWLKSLEGNQPITRQILISKINDILELRSNQEEPNKKSLWFYLYAKRLKGENCEDKVKITYPLAFKHEVANNTKHFSKKMISKIFSIDRKRICEWANDFNAESLKKRDVSKYVTDPNVDKTIWEWYCQQQNKPTSKEVRMKAAILYDEAGFPRMQCSPGWYYRWRSRHQLPTARTSQAKRDSQLLSWVLIQIDKNKTICHSDLLKQASLLKGADFKASSSWVFRFTKRYVTHLLPAPINLSLPGNLCKEVSEYRNIVHKVISENNLQPHNIVAFDELPLNFTLSDPCKQDSLSRKSGWENCQAAVIISCNANGTVLPTALILRNPFETDDISADEIQPVFITTNGIVNENIIEKWYENLCRFVSIPTLFICDIYRPHIHMKSVFGNDFNKRNVDFMIIPGGCSSQLQPILFGMSDLFRGEIENRWLKWRHETYVSGNFKGKLPGSNDIIEWVQSSHKIVADSCKDLIKNSFLRAGIISSLTEELYP